MIFITLLSLLISPADAGRKPVIPDAVEDALAYAETDRDKAILILEAALSTAKPKELGVVALHAGEQHRLAGHPEKARALFTRAKDTGDKGTRQAGEVGIVLLDSDTGLDARSLALLQKADAKYLTDTQNADRYLFLAIEGARRDDARSVGANTKLALAYAKSDATTKERISASIESLKAGGAGAVNTSPAGGSSTLDRAREALKKGDGPRAAELARRAINAAEPDSFEHLQASYMLRRAESNVPVDPNRIAVLLPLSGKYEGAAKQVQAALQMGYDRGGGNKQLYFIDTGATPESAIEALEKAVLEEGAIAVVGPLLSDTTDALVRGAAALEVPLLSLSQSNEDQQHDWVFQGVPSIGDQTHALVKHMMVEENLKRFAIFAPDTTYGHRAAQAFRSSVEARHGSITGEVFYDPKANALMKYAAKLGKKEIGERGGELYRLRRAAKEAGRNPDTVVLPPVVDFDAIFIPDSARKIPIACAALAYEEFPVGEFRPRTGDTLLPLLGLNGWNRASLVSAGGEYARNSRFTETFTPARGSAFVSAYKEMTGRTPTALEAVTVDAGKLLASAAKGPARDREAFRLALESATASNTATGVTSITDRRANTPIEILTIDRSGIRRLSDLLKEEEASND